jgi:hypothetical protein
VRIIAPLWESVRINILVFLLTARNGNGSKNGSKDVVSVCYFQRWSEALETMGLRRIGTGAGPNVFGAQVWYSAIRGGKLQSNTLVQRISGTVSGVVVHGFVNLGWKKQDQLPHREHRGCLPPSP